MKADSVIHCKDKTAPKTPMLILHPHDAFVRDFLGDIHQARDFFRLTLPPPFQATFDQPF
jgi:hypothetical protein